MLLDMYLFFSLPFPRPVRPARKASPKTRRRTPSDTGVAAVRSPKADKEAAPGSRTPSRPVPGTGGQGARGKRRTVRPSLQVIEGGRAGIP
ncbi:hypothetical protein HPC49_40190 [Pyxidicoccus fallax]|uniref:Uncharacterized protein n=1 Tax=Pyxidicoccus fallax TaxID=394095 RepID=A0A848LQ13_9BACT|nr:hypothetical protein [Pyxidicoccus fallax]NMO19732.1 hypothetical protein [Pyxidicoccus fallax]NPC84421.1 hypothetical protein [Pyxidicoccus fallax]